jgi:hypothetical protein
MVLDVGEVETLREGGRRAKEKVSTGRIGEGMRRGLTISDFGATLQFSLQRLARPLTTSALLPINRRRPMTFLRQVPILSRPDLISIHPTFRPMPDYPPPQHVTLFSFLQDQDQLVDPVDLVFDTLNQGSKGVGNIVDKGIGNPVRCDRDVILEGFDTSANVLRVRGTSEMELRCSKSSKSRGRFSAFEFAQCRRSTRVEDSPIKSLLGRR